ncbi:DUF2897 family protein [Alteromonas sp. S005]|uniref:DUF2897 family protein n=1 Tax=Alteromonas sp. S005 TaxID=3117400 RepID=UPI002FDF149E
MSTTWVIIVIVLVLGVVIGNITLLKYSAKFKFPTPSKPYDDDKDGNEYGDENDNPNRDSNRPHAETESAGDNASLKQTHSNSGDNDKKSVK